jgi:hypothetical protein
MVFVHRGASASGAGVGFAHVSALFRVSVIARAGEVIDARSGVDPNDRIGRATRTRLLVGRELACAGCRWSRVVRRRAGAGAEAAGCCHGNSEPVVGAGAGIGAGAAAAPCGMVSLPARHAATNERFVCPDARIAALLAAYSSLHWLAVFTPVLVGAGPKLGAGAAVAGAAVGAVEASPPFC